LKSLTEGAKKEGIVYIRRSMPLIMMNSQELSLRQYPLVEGTLYEIGAEQIVNRAVTEYRSGVPSADVISIRGTLCQSSRRRKNHRSLQKPMTAFLRRGFNRLGGFHGETFATAMR